MNFEIHAYISLVFPLSLPGHSLGYHVAFSCHVTLASSHLSVSQSLSFMNLTFWKISAVILMNIGFFFS